MPELSAAAVDREHLAVRLLPTMVIGIMAVTFTATSCAGIPAEAGGAQAVPTIRQIEFTGNTRLSSRKLSQAIGIRVGDRSTSEAIDGAMARIVAAYRAIGSDLALMVDVTPVDSSHTRINFVIDEAGTGGNRGATPRSGARSGGAPRPPPPATRQ